MTVNQTNGAGGRGLIDGNHIDGVCRTPHLLYRSTLVRRRGTKALISADKLSTEPPLLLETFFCPIFVGLFHASLLLIVTNGKLRHKGKLQVTPFHFPSQ